MAVVRSQTAARVWWWLRCLPPCSLGLPTSLSSGSSSLFQRFSQHVSCSPALRGLKSLFYSAPASNRPLFRRPANVPIFSPTPSSSPTRLIFMSHLWFCFRSSSPRTPQISLTLQIYSHKRSSHPFPRALAVTICIWLRFTASSGP